MFLLAHLSDPHLPAMPRARLRDLLNKRAIGLANWRLRRHLEHRADILAAILADLREHHPDHVAVTGDLVNVALPAEFPLARTFLESIGPPERVSFVPGNHDAYVRAAAGAGALHWGGYLAGDPPADPERAAFPFVRRRGPLLLIGLSTAVPTGPFMAWGRLGHDQLVRLGGILRETAAERRFRTILLHHPPVRAKGDRFKHLVDAGEFRAVLRQHGADLVVHGHSHVRSLVWLEGPRQSIPVLGVPSASAAGGHHHPAGYNLLAIEPDGDTWRLDLIERALGSNGAVEERGRQSLHPKSES